MTNIILYTAAGRQIQQDLTQFGDPPTDAIALKFGDDVSDAEWITDEKRLKELKRKGARVHRLLPGLSAFLTAPQRTAILTYIGAT